MAYVNILSVPGLTYTLHYYADTSPVSPPSVPLAVGSGKFTLAAGSDWNNVFVEITGFAGAVLPCPARIKATALEFGSGSPYSIGLSIVSSVGGGIGGVGGAAPYTGTLTGVASVSDKYFRVSAGYPSDYAEAGYFEIELDTTFVDPVFWQDFEGTYEDTQLHKQVLLVAHPAVVGVEGVPAHEVCVPDPPEVPGPGGSGNLSEGGGSGSSPPGGGGPAPPAEPRITCFDNGHGGQCCRDQNGRPVGSGCP